MVTITLGVMTTTAQHIDGHPVGEHLGIVGADSLVVFQRLRRRAGHSDTSLQRGQRLALETLARRASMRGATAVIGIEIDVVSVGYGKLLVSAVGTAVRL